MNIFQPRKFLAGNFLVTNKFVFDLVSELYFQLTPCTLQLGLLLPRVRIIQNRRKWHYKW